jgi:sulfide:quinone oxidoreductase
LQPNSEKENRQMKKTVIIGGGFAGVEAAIKLRKNKHEVVLISDRSYLFIYPISIWVPVKKKRFDDVKIDLDLLAKKHGFSLVLDKVELIDSANNQLQLSTKEAINYDYLLLAMGMQKLKMRGMEHTHSICGKPTESVVIADKLEELVARGHGKIAIGFGGNPKDPTATAVRGGPAFELLFNISHYLKKLGLRDQFEINFFAPMKEPGRRMGEKPYQKMGVFFDRYKIKQYVGKKIVGFSPEAVLFEDENQLQSDLTIFIAAGQGHELVEKSKLPISEAGFAKIDPNCKLIGHDNIYAAGDTAEITGPSWAAKQGHIAEVMANVAAFNIHQHSIGGKERQTYTEHLDIVCVMDSGDGAAFIQRTNKRELIIPLPIVGHWMKKAWGFYYKNSKLGRIPRIPGM